MTPPVAVNPCGDALVPPPPRIKVLRKYSNKCPSLRLFCAVILELLAPLFTYLRYQYHPGFDS